MTSYHAARKTWSKRVKSAKVSKLKKATGRFGRCWSIYEDQIPGLIGAMALALMARRTAQDPQCSASLKRACVEIAKEDARAALASIGIVEGKK